MFNFNVEKAAKISSNKAVKDLFIDGGVLNDCRSEGYNLIFSKNECILDKNILFNNFIEKFGEHFNKYLDRLGGGINRHDYSYKIEGDKLIGYTEEYVEFVNNGLSYYFIPNFTVNLDYNPLDFIELLKQVIDREECLQSIHYNELVDDESKIVNECGFGGDYMWRINKREDKLLFDATGNEELTFVGKIDFSFAISLNSFKLLKENLL